MTKKRIIALALALLLLVGVSSALAATAGSADDPLITKSYAESDYTQYALAQADAAITTALSGAALPQGESGFSAASLPYGGSVQLLIGGSVILSSGSASVSIAAGEVVNVTTGETVSSGSQLIKNNRYMAMEDSSAVVTAASGSAVLTDGLAVVSANSAPPASFSDVAASDWFYDEVNYCVQNGVFEGRGDGSFGPKAKMLASELITVLFRTAGHTTDNSGAVWYSKQLAWASDNGLVSASSFSGEANITRESFIVMFYKTVGLTGKYDTAVTEAMRSRLKTATDYASLSAGNLDALAWSVSVGLIEGTDSASLTINPSGSITRSEVCAMLTRYYQGLGA